MRMSRKLFVILGVMIGLAFVSPLVAADTSATALKTSMQKLPPIMQSLQAAISAKDYFATAERFMDLAHVFKDLDDTVPAPGDKAKWDEIHGRMINAAFKGIGACGTRDDDAIQKALQDIAAARDEGHAAFIKQK
jgi:hypothetical protein